MDLVYHLGLSLEGQRTKKKWQIFRKRLTCIMTSCLLMLKRVRSPHRRCKLYSVVCTLVFLPVNLHLINLIYPFCWPCDRLAYFKAAYEMFDAEFYVKADDSIYLRPGKVTRYQNCCLDGLICFTLFLSHFCAR